MPARKYLNKRTREKYLQPKQHRHPYKFAEKYISVQFAHTQTQTANKCEVCSISKKSFFKQKTTKNKKIITNTKMKQRQYPEWESLEKVVI